mmetsp:Transcript_36960/g.80253  ORF Transcript_36960/g.80253 Transcript_36960/m.80253 type:complete len:96 (+) Transcript_36960:181-468(+)
MRLEIRHSVVVLFHWSVAFLLFSGLQQPQRGRKSCSIYEGRIAETEEAFRFVGGLEKRSVGGSSDEESKAGVGAAQRACSRKPADSPKRRTDGPE